MSGPVDEAMRFLCVVRENNALGGHFHPLMEVGDALL
jgi:hypothetical protein